MLNLPVLDDKTASQMVEEAVARIPTLTAEWTDFNEQDTGILLLETFAAFAEMQNFYLDQVGERFLDRYLTLAGMDAPAGESSAERFERFARDCRRITRAVTASDYEEIARGFLPSDGGRGADKVHASCEDGQVLLSVYRAETSFSKRDLEELRAYLEPYRLLTVRLKVAAASYEPLRVRCKAELAGEGERAAECREAIGRLVEQYIGDGEIGAPVNIEALRLDLLALPFVRSVPVLELEPVRRANLRSRLDVGNTASLAGEGASLVGLDKLEIDFI